MSNEGHSTLDAMSSEFIAEIKDDLASLETDLLAIEKKGAGVDGNLINRAFRAIHSIKGGAGFLSFEQLSSLSHDMESVLMQVREKKLVINSDIADALLSGFDKMRLMVEQMGKETSFDFAGEQAALQKILNPSPASGASRETASGSDGHLKTDPDSPALAAGDETGPEPDVRRVMPVSSDSRFKDKFFFIDARRLENALNSQKYLYVVFLRLKQDLTQKGKNIASIVEEIRSIGDILYSDEDAQEDKDGVYFVIGTILDPPLLIQVLEIEKEQLALLNKQFAEVETILKSLDSIPRSSGRPAAAEESAANPPAPPEETDKEAASNVQMPQTGPESSQTIRINMDLISRLMNRAGELVLARNQLRPLLEGYARQDKAASHMMQNLDMVTTDIQEAIMQMRMQPVVDLLGKYRRVVRDIARRMAKKVDFVIEGANVELDRSILERLANPVTHLIRNCIDHGIETPEERKKLSKPETGIIKVKAFHQGGHVHLSICDDGAGIDPQLVLSKAFEKGLVSEDQIDSLSDKQKANLIFLPGFSTSEKITNISGRGVGMDVVKTNIERLRGQIEIESTMGRGTNVHLIIPLTLAIVPSLIVSARHEKFAIPQVSIKEIIYLEPGRLHHQVETIGGSEVLRLRENLLPILRLRNVLGLKTYIEQPGTGRKIVERRKAIADRRQKEQKGGIQEKRNAGNDRRKTSWDATYIIVLKLGNDRFGICVDDLHDIEEVVVEPLSDYVKNLKCFSGATILGDGNVIMILDIPGIASASSLRFENIKTEEQKRHLLQEEKILATGEKKNLIVFCNDEKEYFALQLEHVSRLEPVNPAEIHYTGGSKYAEYDGVPVFLVSMDELFRAGKCRMETSQVFAIFLKRMSTKVGILASEIIDTLEISDPLNRDAACVDAVAGKLFVNDMMIQVLDHEKLGELIECRVSTVKEKA